jgi:hypothetical protein
MEFYFDLISILILSYVRWTISNQMIEQTQMNQTISDNLLINLYTNETYSMM